jgi:hypothetical protein
MCDGCWEKYGKPTKLTPEIRRAHRLVGNVYDYHGAGGSGHIVFDDWNLDDGSIEMCLERNLQRRELGEVSRPEFRATRRALEAFKKLTEVERATALAFGRYFQEEGSPP